VSDASQKDVAGWIALLVVGISLNTVGIALSRAGAIRFVLMGAGLLLLLVALIGLLRARQR
jgi:hypothetical protein